MPCQMMHCSNDVYKHCSVYTGQSLQCGDAIVVLTKHYVYRQLNMTIVYFRRDFYLPFCGGGVTFPNLCEAVCAAAASSSTWILLRNLLLNRRNVRIIGVDVTYWDHDENFLFCLSEFAILNLRILIFWPRFYIVVLGITFLLFTLHLLFLISIWTFISFFLLGLLYLFYVWTFFPFFIWNLSSNSSCISISIRVSILLYFFFNQSRSQFGFLPFFFKQSFESMFARAQILS